MAEFLSITSPNDAKTLITVDIGNGSAGLPTTRGLGSFSAIVDGAWRWNRRG
jgi:hypothetical protein